MKVIFFSLEHVYKDPSSIQEHLSKLDAEINALAKEIEEYQTVPLRSLQQRPFPIEIVIQVPAFFKKS